MAIEILYMVVPWYALYKYKTKIPEGQLKDNLNYQNVWPISYFSSEHVKAKVNFCWVYKRQNSA